MTLVQVKLELGHRAEFRQKPTKEGFTHDWVVFVRGPQDKPIQHFVDKVVFYLHESFAKPKRVVRDPPYQIKESGYAGFTLPIEVYFKNKDEPKKIVFEYDLFLHLENCPPVNHIRCEKLTFQNPTEEFQKKLTKAGGILVSQPNLSPPHHIQGPAPPSIQTTSHSHPEIMTSSASHRYDSENAAPKSSKIPPRLGPVSQNDMSFTSLFGAPLKPSHQSSALKTPHTTKESGVSLHSNTPLSNSSTSSQQALPKKISCPSQVNSSSSSSSNNKPGITHAKPKPVAPPFQTGSVTAETAHSRKQGGGNSHGNGPSAPLLPAPCKDLKMGVVAKETTAKGVSKSSISPAPSHASPHTSPFRGKDFSVKTNEVIKKRLLPHSNGLSIASSVPTVTTSTSSAFAQSSASALKHHKENRKKRERGESEDLIRSPNTVKRKIALIAEPIPNREKLEGSSDIRRHQQNRPELPRPNPTLVEAPAEPLPSPPTRSNTSSSAEETFQDSSGVNVNNTNEDLPNDSNNNNNNTSSNSTQHNPIVPTAPSFSREYVDDLLSLQQDLMSLQDRHLVQRIVDVIVETRKYTISPSTFDFDLCRLEKSTVARIKEILLA